MSSDQLPFVGCSETRTPRVAEGRVGVCERLCRGGGLLEGSVGGPQVSTESAQRRTRRESSGF